MPLTIRYKFSLSCRIPILSWYLPTKGATKSSLQLSRTTTHEFSHSDHFQNINLDKKLLFSISSFAPAMASSNWASKRRDSASRSFRTCLYSRRYQTVLQTINTADERRKKLMKAVRKFFNSGLGGADPSKFSEKWMLLSLFGAVLNNLVVLSILFLWGVETGW